MIKFLLLLILSSSLWAAEWSLWRVSTKLFFENGYLSFNREKACSNESLKDILHCSKDNSIAYYSSLDSDYVVFIYNQGIGIWGIHDEMNGNYSYKKSLTEILNYEFMKLQEWGVIDISADSASILINSALSKMLSVPDTNKKSGSIVGIEFEYGFEQDHDSLIVYRAAVDGGALDAPSELFVLMPELKTMRLNRIDLFNKMKISKVGMRTFYISGVKDLTPFRAYDLNGVLLNQGAIQKGIVNVKKTPAILEISNTRILLK